MEKPRYVACMGEKYVKSIVKKPKGDRPSGRCIRK
jgi:hypothetical protein